MPRHHVTVFISGQAGRTEVVAVEIVYHTTLAHGNPLPAEGVIYDELRTGFGVRGVPAMVIEAATPEIESETSRMLAEKYILRYSSYTLIVLRIPTKGIGCG